MKMLWQDACAFYNRLPVCSFSAAANAVNDPKAVADALGTEGVGLILQNRGLLSCAGTVEGAVGGYVRIDGLLGNQLLCEAAIKGRGGEVVPIGEEEILVSSIMVFINVCPDPDQFTQKNTSGEYSNWFQAQPYFARQIVRHGSQLEI